MEEKIKLPKPPSIPNPNSLEYLERKRAGIKIQKRKKEEKESNKIQARRLFDEGYGIAGFTNLHGDAVVKFLEALEYNPEEIEAYYQLGLIYFKNKDYNKAKEYFEKYLDKKPTNKRNKSVAEESIIRCNKKLQDNK